MRTLITSILCLAFNIAVQAAEETTTYHNPVDKKDYRAKWRNYTAEPSGTPAPEGKVKMGTVRLLAEQALFDRNTSAEKIAEFIVAAHKRISAVVPKTAPAFELLVQFTLTAQARPKVEMSSKGDASQKLLQAIYDSLAKATDLRSKKDALPFQVQFSVRDKP
ncbi:MAG: hypothetical protein QOH88_2400 [Verrucomicrobiota bacterium]|jgi:hypothetical protein